MRRVFLLSVGEFFIDVFVSSILAGVSQQLLHLDTYQGIVVGLMLFISIVALQIKYRIEQIGKNLDEIPDEMKILPEIGDKVNWIFNQQRVVERVNANLQQISDGFKELSIRKGSDDLFLHWYFEKIENLHRHLQYTLDNESFDFDSILLQERRKVLDIMKGRETDFFWALSSCKSIPSFLATEGNDFIREMDRRFQAGSVTTIRRLFVYDNQAELSEFVSKLFFRLHQESGYEYKVISMQDFDAVYKAFNDKSLARDFGVYGMNFIWETTPEDVFRKGVLSRNRVRINTYKRLYENLWEFSVLYPVTDETIVQMCKGERIGKFRELLQSKSSADKSELPSVPSS